MAVTAEQLNIILAVRDEKFAKALKQNERRVGNFAKKTNKGLNSTTAGFSALAKGAALLLPALSAGAVLAQVKNTVSALDNIGKTADKIGITTDALQELRTVAESAGVSQGSLDSSLERFSKRLGEASFGMGAAKKALEEMGLSADDLIKMGLDEALGVVADKMAAIPDPTQRAARAAALFGREGVAMVNLLREGSAGMATMRNEARALGIVIDEDLIREAEGAQTQLDLMGRVISAQLNSALIELAPLLVGGATALADVARALATAANSTSDFLFPQSELQIATDNLVLALGDEIRQSQQLEAALSGGITMSAEAARVKLQEAIARQQNVQAIIAEHRAMALGSDEVSDVTSRIKDNLNSIRTMRSRVDQYGFEEDKRALEQMSGALRGNLLMRQQLIKTDERLQEQLERSQSNVDLLNAAISNSRGGIVNVNGGTPVEPIDPTARTSSGAGKVREEVTAAIPELSDYDAVLKRVNETFSGAMVEAGNYSDVLGRLNTLYENGQMSADDYKASLEVLGEQFEEIQAQQQAIADTIESEMTSAFMGIIDGTKSAKEAFADMARAVISELMRVLVVQQMVGSFDSATGKGSGIVGAIMGAFSGRASGGSVMAGQAYRVGEHGPEPFIPAQNGRILSVAQAKSAMGGGQGGPTVNQTINVTTGVQQTVRAEIKSLMPQITEAAVAATRADKMRRPA